MAPNDTPSTNPHHVYLTDSIDSVRSAVIHLAIWHTRVSSISVSDQSNKGNVKNLTDAMTQLKLALEPLNFSVIQRGLFKPHPLLRNQLHHVASVCLRIDQYINEMIGTPIPDCWKPPDDTR